MKDGDTVRRWEKLADSIGTPAEILRGSLLERTIRHKKGCRTCAEGGGHPAWILSVNYPGGRNKQISLRPDQKLRVKRWLANYHQLKDKLESICELNHILLRSEE
jgi:Family of unknown function (DUF6788)